MVDFKKIYQGDTTRKERQVKRRLIYVYTRLQEKLSSPIQTGYMFLLKRLNKPLSRHHHTMKKKEKFGVSPQHTTFSFCNLH